MELKIRRVPAVSAKSPRSPFIDGSHSFVLFVQLGRDRRSSIFTVECCTRLLSFRPVCCAPQHIMCFLTAECAVRIFTGGESLPLRHAVLTAWTRIFLVCIASFVAPWKTFGPDPFAYTNGYHPVVNPCYLDCFPGDNRNFTTAAIGRAPRLR